MQLFIHQGSLACAGESREDRRQRGDEGHDSCCLQCRSQFIQPPAPQGFRRKSSTTDILAISVSAAAAAALSSAARNNGAVCSFRPSITASTSGYHG